MNSTKIENIKETMAHLNFLIKYIAYYSNFFEKYDLILIFDTFYYFWKKVQKT